MSQPTRSLQVDDVIGDYFYRQLSLDRGGFHLSLISWRHHAWEQMMEHSMPAEAATFGDRLLLLILMPIDVSRDATETSCHGVSRTTSALTHQRRLDPGVITLW